MVLPTETTKKEESEDFGEETKYTGTSLDGEIKVIIESSQVTEELDWCIQNQTEFSHRDLVEGYNDVIDYKKLLEYCPQRCTRCEDIYIDSYTLLCHNLKHLQLKLIPITRHRYQCADCLQYFKTKSMFKRHILKQNLEPAQNLLGEVRSNLKKIGPFQRCSGKIMNYKNWHSHVSSVHGKGQYECMTCHSKFKCLRYLKRHKMYVHYGVIRYKAKQPLVEVKCSLCPAVLAHKHALKTHMRNCHCEKVKCDICQSELKKSYLRNHIRRVHYNDGKEYKCDCGKKFKSPRYLKIHKKNSHKKHS